MSTNIDSTTVPTTDLAAVMAALNAMSASERLSLIATAQAEESARLAAAAAARNLAIGDCMTAANADLAVIAASLAECALAHDCLFSVSYDSKLGTLKVSQILNTPTTRAARNRATNSAHGNASTASFSRRAVCKTELGEFSTMAAAARAHGMTDLEIYEMGGGHAGRAMTAKKIVFEMLDAQ